MMLVTEGLRVALVTTHLPLSQVSAAITPERLTRAIEILHQDLSRRFGHKAPRILVCGLNPHAGEGGMFGDDETTLIAPAIAACRAAGIDANRLQGSISKRLKEAFEG